MLSPSFFYDSLIENGTDFFAGVPDSLLKSFCAYVTDTAPPENHIIAANEGCAAALAAGYYFAENKIPLVYMQNSGIGNAVNPLLSLIDPEVYSAPLLLIIGWRGEPGVADEPQHLKQGKVTARLLEAMQIPYAVLDGSPPLARAQLSEAYAYMRAKSAPYAFLIKKGTFEEYILQKTASDEALISREAAIEKITLAAPQGTVFVSTTGMASRELYELREKHRLNHDSDFLTVGSMGHASQIAYAIASRDSARRRNGRLVFCLDGDGAAIMHMGGIATIGARGRANLCHFVLNNGAHDSVGGQPTVALKIDLPAVARACGYKTVFSVSSIEGLDSALERINAAAREGKTDLTFIEVKVRRGARKDLGRPKSSPLENKKAFMNFLKNGDSETFSV